MLPYSRGLILDNTNNYGIVKTEAVFGFGPSERDSFVNNNFNNSDEEWFLSHGNIKSLSGQNDESRAFKPPSVQISTAAPQQRNTKKEKLRSNKKKHRKSKKVNKCIFKVLKKGQGLGKRKRKRGGKGKVGKKYMVPVLIGLMAAKTLLIPIALKVLAFISAKGLMMGFFSTVMASVLSLKGMFEHHHGYYQNRKDDTKTQVEIIQVPAKSEDHYYDEHYRRGDYVPEDFQRYEYTNAGSQFNRS